MLNELNEAVKTADASWLSLKSKEDGAVEGVVLHMEEREKTWNGDVVLSRSTGKPRVEWVFTLQIAGNDAPSKIPFAESAQRAITKAVKEAGVTAEEGDILKIAVSKDRESQTSQPDFKAKWTKGTKPLPITTADTSSDDDPF